MKMKEKIKILLFLTIILIGNQAFKKYSSKKPIANNITSKTDTLKNSDTLRTWKNRYSPFNRTNKEGKIVVNICADVDGNIISATYNQEKSTSQDTFLINLAINAAKLSKLTKDTITNKIQCGTIKYNFKNAE